MTIPSGARKPRQRKPVVRTIRLELAPSEGGPGVVHIQVGKDEADYFLRPLASDFGQAFALEKFGWQRRGDEPDIYHVLLAGDQSTCECQGFLRWNHCKHVEGLAALVARGKLLLPSAATTV